MIHIFKHRKGQTYEQIKLAKNRLFLFTCFNPLSPANSDQHQFSPDHIYTMSRDKVFRNYSETCIKRTPSGNAVVSA